MEDNLIATPTSRPRKSLQECVQFDFKNKSVHLNYSLALYGRQETIKPESQLN